MLCFSLRVRAFLLIATASVALLALGVGQSFAARPVVTETYNIPEHECNGLRLEGVSYSFTTGGTPSSDCQAGTFTGPFSTNHLSAPNIEGNAAGVLTLSFAVPTTIVRFGFALDTGTPQAEGVTVRLYAPGRGVLRKAASSSATNDPSFVGGEFEYAGAAIRSVTIAFAGAPRFALDNLVYTLGD